MKRPGSAGIVVAPTVSSESQTIWIWIVAVCFAMGGFFMMGNEAMPFEGVIRGFAARDEWRAGVSLASNPIV